MIYELNENEREYVRQSLIMSLNNVTDAIKFETPGSEDDIELHKELAIYELLVDKFEADFTTE